MVQPKKPPLSLRIPEATRVRVEKWAAAQKVPRNAAYVQLIERGLKSAGPHPGLNERPLKPNPAASVAASKPFLDLPVGNIRGPMQKGSAKKR